MRHTILSIIGALGLLFGSTASLYSQNSLPAPGSGGSFSPAPSGGGGGGGFGPGPAGPGPAAGPIGPGPGCLWGGPWGPSASLSVYAPIYTSSWVNTGKTTVVGVGYDATGVWRTVPMKVKYAYNGVYYTVKVLNAWDPWTDSWNYDVDVPAIHTSYYLRGTTYNYYAVLSTGTYYFNL